MFTGLLDDAEALAELEPAAGGAPEALLVLLLLLQAASASPAAATAATTAPRRRYRGDAEIDGTARLLCACSLGGGLAVSPVSRVPARLTGSYKGYGGVPRRYLLGYEISSWSTPAP